MIIHCQVCKIDVPALFWGDHQQKEKHKLMMAVYKGVWYEKEGLKHDSPTDMEILRVQLDEACLTCRQPIQDCICDIIPGG